jgi:hypothetical protein
MTTCPWYQRWWHRQLRKADTRDMLPAIARAAVRHGYGQWTVSAVWESFKETDGQEHWRCACALAEREKQS